MQEGQIQVSTYPSRRRSRCCGGREEGHQRCGEKGAEGSRRREMRPRAEGGKVSGGDRERERSDVDIKSICLSPSSVRPWVCVCVGGGDGLETPVRGTRENQ